MVFFPDEYILLVSVMNEFILIKVRIVHLPHMQYLLRHEWDNAL